MQTGWRQFKAIRPAQGPGAKIAKIISFKLPTVSREEVRRMLELHDSSIKNR